MVRDVPGQGEAEAALEYGVDYGLEEGEELPEDIEDLTEAQYAVYSMFQTLQGAIEEEAIEDTMGDKGSGIVVPN